MASKSTIPIFFFLICLCYSQCCTKFLPNSNKCSECPSGTHLFKKNCLIDVENCETYLDGFLCSKCKSNFTLTNGLCQEPIITPPVISNFSDTSYNISRHDNLMILADYARITQTTLSEATVLWGFVRKYTNGTEQTIVDFETADKKYYRTIAVFLPSPFSFNIISNTALTTKPAQPIGIFSSQLSNLVRTGYDILSYEERKTEQSFKVVDGLIRSVNSDIFGTTPVAMVIYKQTKGLNIEYIIMYETTDKKIIYEATSFYQVLRDKGVILSVNKTNFK